MGRSGVAPLPKWRQVRRRALRRSPQLKAFLRSLMLNWTARPNRQDRGYSAWAAGELAGKRIGTGPATSDPPVVSFVIVGGNEDSGGLALTLSSLAAQTHSGWEAIVAGALDPAAAVADVRIRWLDSSASSTAVLANQALELVDGTFVAFLSAGHWLWPDAVAAVRAAADEVADALFSDHDVRTTQGRHTTPTFKPGWNRELLHSCDYVGPLVAMRTDLVRRLGGLNDFGTSTADSWDLHLRLARETPRWVHLPQVLCSRPSAPAQAHDPGEREVVANDLAARGHADAAFTRNLAFPSAWDLRYALRAEPLVSIVIPSKNQLKLVRRCVESIYSRSSYRRFEVILMDTGSDDPDVLSWYDEMGARTSTFRLVSWPEQPFSYSRTCNEGARIAEGSILVMLNNDTEVISSDWIERLGAAAQRPEVGAVGCQLYFPGGRRVQHAGVGLGIEGVAGNLLSGVYPALGLTRTQALMLHTSHQLSAVTAACLAIRKDAFSSVGGFDERLAVTFNDVDLCLRLQQAGLVNLYESRVQLRHHESISVSASRRSAGEAEVEAARDLMARRWQRELTDDPMLNPNLSREDPFCRFQPRRR